MVETPGCVCRRIVEQSPEMLLVIVTLLFCQRLELPRAVCHPGDSIQLTAVSKSGEPAAGVLVDVRTPDGVKMPVGLSDAEGHVKFTAEQVGTHEFHAVISGGPPIVVVVYEVVARPRRWLYAVFLTPLGILLIWWNLTKLRRRA